MEEILHYFPSISNKQIHQLTQLGDLYKYWNERINLISRKDIDALYTKHILHSLAIAKYIQFLPKASIIDIGTGGGFPGIPLAIMFPESNFYLIDSIAKKIKVVDDIIEKLELTNARAEQIRAEKVKEKFDFVVSRAVTQLPKFYNWVRFNIRTNSKHQIPNGIIYLKGGDLIEELAPFRKRITSTPITNYFSDPFFDTKKIIHLSI